MKNAPTIEEIILSMGLDEDQLAAHQHAWESLTHHGSERKLNAIDKEIRKKIASFYKKLQNLGIYPGPMQDGKLTWQEIVDYKEGWFRALKSRRDEDPLISRSEVNDVIEKSFEELREKMKIKARPMLPLVREAIREVK